MPQPRSSGSCFFPLPSSKCFPQWFCAILWRNTLWGAVYYATYMYKVVLTFESMDEILWYNSSLLGVKGLFSTFTVKLALAFYNKKINISCVFRLLYLQTISSHSSVPTQICVLRCSRLTVDFSLHVQP